MQRALAISVYSARSNSKRSQMCMKWKCKNSLGLRLICRH